MADRRPDRVPGPPHDDFWAFCAQGELRLQRCANCGKLSWPATEDCEYCGDGRLSWERVSGRGKIIAWCTFERDYYAGLFPMPWETILVELEEGPLFISNPNGFGHQDMAVGMPVAVSFVDCEDAAGAFRLPVFDRA
jgi:uncharacterized OB-fold protein